MCREQSARPVRRTETRCTCDHFEHYDTGECTACHKFCGPISVEVARDDLAAWRGEAKS